MAAVAAALCGCRHTEISRTCARRRRRRRDEERTAVVLQKNVGETGGWGGLILGPHAFAHNHNATGEKKNKNNNSKE